MSVMKRVLLLYPSQFYFIGRDRIVTSRLYLTSLKTFIQKEASVDVCDFEVELGRPSSEEDIQIFMRRADSIFSQMPNYDIVGISCYTSYSYLSTVNLGRLIRKRWPNAVIVVGGYHPTAMPHDFEYDKTPFDFIVRGEGEKVLRSILREDIQRDSTPQVLVGEQLKPKEWPRISHEKYYSKKAPFVVALSRGCSMSCKFCCQSGDISSLWRTLPPADALDYIKQIYRLFGPQFIGFADPNFGFNRKWLVQFLEGLVKLNLPITYWAECRTENIDDYIIYLITKLNFNVYFGVDSLSPKTLTIMGKTRNPSSYITKTLAVIHKCIRKGVRCELGFIANHPGETVDSFRETLNALWELINNYHQVSCILKMSPFVLYPGNYVFKNRKHYEEMYGYQVKEPYWWKINTQNMGDLSTKSIGSASLLRLYGFSPTFWTKEWNVLKNEALKKVPASLLPSRITKMIANRTEKKLLSTPVQQAGHKS